MKSCYILLIAIILFCGTSIKAFSQKQDSTINESSKLSFGVNTGFANKYLSGYVLQSGIGIST